MRYVGKSQSYVMLKETVHTVTAVFKSVYSLRTCNTVLQWKLTFQLLKKHSAFYTPPYFTAKFKRTPSWARWIQVSTAKPVVWKCILIWSYHLINVYASQWILYLQILRSIFFVHFWSLRVPPILHVACFNVRTGYFHKPIIVCPDVTPCSFNIGKGLADRSIRFLFPAGVGNFFFNQIVQNGSGIHLIT